MQMKVQPSRLHLILAHFMIGPRESLHPRFYFSFIAGGARESNDYVLT
jgi:hypothetical protein